MYGLGVLKGMIVTLGHFVDTYVDDIRWLSSKYVSPEKKAYRQSTKGKGLFTVQYPDEKLNIPERFRYIPFLIYEEKDGKHEDRCTSCGICAKVCPPQCIWIVRTDDPVTKRPVPQPKEFYIDTDICMNCGYCAEYCPFDAIKMDHNFELASFDRTTAHIYDKAKLDRPLSYYAALRPTDYTAEEKARAEEEAKKAAKKAAAAPAPAAKS